MTFSIIIPTFNRCQFLREAIYSSLNQKNVEFEVIVIDNASTDGTLELMNEFNGVRNVKYIRNDTNIGMIPNWSKALYNYCSGEWVLILSDDDLLIDENYLFKSKKLIEEEEGIVIIHANRIVEFEEKEIRKKHKLPRICEGTWMFEHYLETSDNMFSFVTSIFKKEIAIKINAFTKFDIVGSDTMEFLRMSLYGKVGFVEDFVAKYRIHKNNQYFRFGVKYLLTTNIETFEAPYREALNMNLFNEKLLNRWKRRLIFQYIDSNFREILMKGKGDFKLLFSFIYYSLSHYPSSWYIFLKPKAIIRFVIYGVKKWI